MWVHGTAVVPQREGYFVNKVRYGGYSTFLGTGTEYFHIAIPTPSRIEDKWTRVERIMVYYSTGINAKIIRVEVYSGVVQIGRFDNLNLSGTHDRQTDNSNTWVLKNKPYNTYGGLGISILVEFGDTTPQGVSSIHFHSAGADFFVET